jgi:redox-sensitive bicupin YhaK (pirin superfamily)
VSVLLQLTGHDKDLGGGFVVRRLLPAAQRQAVGPFLFFDHFGPVTVEPGTSHDVRPHPHIGLATVTYLFEGAITHRDSLGFEQRIEPGAVNWMTSGRGIVHSERGPENLRNTAYVNHGLQLWAALPLAREEAEPAFLHTPAAEIPVVTLGAAEVRVLVGEAFGKTSPVKTFSQTIYLDVRLGVDARLELPPLAEELAIYVVEGEVSVDGQSVSVGTLAVLTPGSTALLSCSAPARLVVIGGEPLDARRYMWWNFVSSRKERIVQASNDWLAQGMGQVPGETEFIPLPERRFLAS